MSEYVTGTCKCGQPATRKVTRRTARWIGPDAWRAVWVVEGTATHCEPCADAEAARKNIARRQIQYLIDKE